MHSNEFFTFETGEATDVGCIRKINEDSMVTRPESGVWVVADGMGGHAAGDFASQTIVHEMTTVGTAATMDDLQARFMQRLAHANEIIVCQAAELNAGTIGATVVSLLVHGGDYACIWSGDSRVYLLRDGRLTQQSRDHTEVQALVDAGSITAEQARNWPRKNVITRAIGVADEPECDVVQGELRVGDRFLLCSDGLTEHMTDPEIAEMLKKFAPQRACDELVAKTVERGAKDNVTVVAMQCLPPPPLNADECPDPSVNLDELS